MHISNATGPRRPRSHHPGLHPGAGAATVDAAVASTCYAVFHGAVREPGHDGPLDAYLWSVVDALARCPPPLKPELERELLKVARHLGLLAPPPHGDATIGGDGDRIPPRAA